MCGAQDKESDSAEFTLQLYIGEACWAFLFGVIIGLCRASWSMAWRLTEALFPGPYGAGIFDPRHWGGSTEVTNMITLEFTRVVLAIGVFAIGVELPKAYMARHWKSMFFLLVPVMTWVRPDSLSSWPSSLSICSLLPLASRDGLSRLASFMLLCRA